MSNPTHIVYEPGKLCLLFETMDQAVEFIKGQSTNPKWWALWTVEVSFEGYKLFVKASTTTSLNIRLT